jgi:hypothetical protein
MSGRALVPEEVRKLLAGPDKQKDEGARDYALIFGMLRLGLRVSEIASLRSSPISQVSADGAYDQKACYDAINGRGARAAIPPRKNAKIWQRATPKSERHIRDENLREIRKVGRKKWKQDCGYHRRSLAETTMFRFKTIVGDRLRTRKIDNQFKELLVKCAVLNRITHLGMPKSYKV